MSNRYSLWVYTPTGVKLAAVDTWITLDYTRSVNNFGTLRMSLPGTFSMDNLSLDNRIAVWRSVSGAPQYLDTETVWFIRDIKKTLSDRGEKLIEVTALSAAELLNRRYVAYFAGTDQASKAGPADDVMKAIVRENLGSLATNTARDWSSYLTVASDLAAGPRITKGFAWRNVLTVLQELAVASVTAGTPTFFDIVCPNSDPASLQFMTYTTQRGTDKSATVTLAPEMGTLTSIVREYDYSSEVTYVYAAGQGLESDRAISEGGDSTRIAASPFNRREYVAQSGFVTTQGGLDSERDGALRDGRPKRSFTAQVVSAGNALYGKDYFFGDRVAVSFDGELATARLDSIAVSLSHGEERISASIRVED